MNDVFAGLILVAALLTPACGGAMTQNEKQDEIIRARDGNIAIQQELDAARKAATLEAYDLFLARHPQHPLAEVARRERAELAARLNQ
jgi:hypothetical protein